MNKKDEKNVFELHVPSCAVIQKMIYCPKHGFVAATMTCGGNQLTFFRTDFLNLERVAWDCNEVLTGRGFHEDIPENVLESIKKNKGFFLSKNLLSVGSEGKAFSIDGATPAANMLYDEAEKFVQSMEVPELESDVPYGAIYDTLGRWLIETGALTEKEWMWSPDSKEEQKAILERDCGGWKLADLMDNIFTTEWTKEWFIESHITRDGVPFSDGEANYPARKRYIYSKEFKHPDAKTRAFLYFK